MPSQHNPVMQRCQTCRRRPAGERDSSSPYCGDCDPNGARFYDDCLTFWNGATVVSAVTHFGKVS